MLTGSGVIFVLTMALLGGAFLRRPEVAPDAAEERANVRFWILGLGLAFSLSVLAALLTYGIVIGEQLLPNRGAEAVRVGAQARQWSWTFTYEDRPDFATTNELHIPAGRPVDVAITTADVIHSFWVPRLAGKLDAIPGHVNVLRIAAERPGRYRGASAEFSGNGYAGHTFVVIAHEPEGWRRFLAGGAR